MQHSKLATIGLAVLAASMARTAAWAADGGRLTVAADGKSAYMIVVPDDADPPRIGQAADLLQSVVAQATGVKPPIVKESTQPKGPAVYLGKSQAARRSGLQVDSIKGWGYLNQVVGDNIFLVGEDGEAGIQDRKDIEYLGTMKAVTAFLEEQVGVRFLLPGANGLHVPKLERLTVDAGMKSMWKPLFDYVIGRTSRDRAYAVANNFFGRTAVLHSYGGHSYYDAVPTQLYGEKKPDYFALVGGVRDPKNNHLCISNPEVQELMLKEMEKHLDRGYQWVELAQTDGYVPCGCKPCAEIHADPGERTWIVHRKLAEAMRTRRPGRKVMIISYPPTQKPPTTFKSFPDNV
ncbi:MAG: DUF4838 domain-containing protein, partial [Planctomycetes bacterium]|nr:DUF4838 domain-containing protein [Planctomycetota bacterium]